MAAPSQQPAFQVTTRGLSRLNRDLRRLSDGAADLKEANMAAAQVVIRAAERDPNAPRRTGTLLGRGRPSKAKGRARILWGGAATPYAGVIHFGWEARGIEAQPWIYDAAEDTRNQWLSEYEQALHDLVDELDNQTY